MAVVTGASSGLGRASALRLARDADLIAWLVTAPAGLVLNQVTVTPLHEKGRP